jgi:hypothetical protein
VCFLSLIKKLAAVAHDGCWATPCRRRCHCAPNGDILTAVGRAETAVGHGGRHEPRRMDVKSAKFSNRRIWQKYFKKYKKVFAKNIFKKYKKILQQEYCKCEQYLASAAFYSQSCIQTRGLQPISYTIQ